MSTFKPNRGSFHPIAVKLIEKVCSEYWIKEVALRLTERALNRTLVSREWRSHKSVLAMYHNTKERKRIYPCLGVLLGCSNACSLQPRNPTLPSSKNHLLESTPDITKGIILLLCRSSGRRRKSSKQILARARPTPRTLPNITRIKQTIRGWRGACTTARPHIRIRHGRHHRLRGRTPARACAPRADTRVSNHTGHRRLSGLLRLLRRTPRRGKGAER